MLEPTILRLEPGQLAVVREALDEALSDLADQLLRLRIEGPIREPWLGDEVSSRMARSYNESSFEALNSPSVALQSYQSELMRVRDNLQTMEENYRRVEGEVAGLWRQG